LDLTSPLAWAPPEDWIRVQVIDSHAAGEPFRVIIGGTSTVPGDSMIERRRFARENLDGLRRALMWEPRGHADMYGGLVGPPTDPASDLSVLFLHNEGFSTMCGHGIIALTKVVIETGILPRVEPETQIKVDTPAGQIEAVAIDTNGTVSSVRFRNVPSFVVDLENTVEVPGLGDVKYDLAFGGAFYAYVDASVLGLSLHPQDTSQLIAVGRAIKEAPPSLSSGFSTASSSSAPPMTPQTILEMCVCSPTGKWIALPPAPASVAAWPSITHEVRSLRARPSPSRAS
jgi:trans-L-3-hydroxyproline dehydratase